MPQILRSHAFLNAEGEQNSSYIDSMNAAIAMVSERSRGKPNKTREAIARKLQLNTDANPDRDQYLQHACELSVAACFCRLQDADVTYEYPGRNGKNIDVSVVQNGIRFNLEVKCPNPKIKPSARDSKGLILRTHGRIPSIQQVVGDLEELSEAIGHEGVVAVLNSDLKVKDALIDSAKKFQTPADKSELNCVVLCGDDGDSLQHYRHCLYGRNGLFTSTSFHPTADYEVVDAVILTNLRLRHDKVFTRRKLSNPWQFELAFNLIFENQRRCERAAPPLSFLGDLLPNYGRQMEAFELPGDIPIGGEDDIKISYFVEHEVSKLDASCFGVENGEA